MRNLKTKLAVLVGLLVITSSLWAASNYIIKTKNNIELRPGVATQAFMDLILENGVLTVDELVGTPSNPAAGYRKLYVKNTGVFFQLDSSGNETPLGSGGDISNLLTDGGFDITAASGTNGLTCATGNTCAKITTASGVLIGDGALEVTMGGSNPVNVTHCYDNSAGSWDDKNAQISLQLNSTITDLQVCYYNGTSEESCTDIDAYPGNSVYEKFDALGIVQTGEDICWKIKSTANPSAGAKVYVDAGFAGEPYLIRNLSNDTDWTDFSSSVTTQGIGTPTINQAFWRQTGSQIEVYYRITTGTVTAAELQVSLPNSYQVKSGYSAEIVGTAHRVSNTSAHYTVLATGGNTVLKMGYRESASNLARTTQNGSFLFGSGEVFTIHAFVPIEGLTSKTEHVVTPARSSWHQYSISQLGNALTDRAAEVEFNLGTATISSTYNAQEIIVASDDAGNTRTKFACSQNCVVQAHWQTTVDTAGQRPQIFKNGTIISDGNAPYVLNAFVTSSASIYLAAGEYITVSTESSVANIAGASRLQLTAYATDLVILAAIPEKKVCYVKDVKSGGTAGGNASGSAYNKRVLNTTSGDCSFLSLSSNEITLSEGTYQVEGSAPAYQVNDHQAALYSEDDLTYDIVGLSAFASSTYEGMSSSVFQGELVLSASETFSVQHFTNSAQATNGLGVQVTTGSTSEVYTTVKITKIK